ncbi:MAG TPA: phosphatidylcholine/phosphatidylserine synthase [Phycisphaerales bacterium]|nr:phosphatidylcholine/phosphatidylserine synthase [Phycisphaerales bacterium]
MFINYPGRKQTVPLRIIVPNLFTTVAMCCGLASIHYSLKGDWDRAVFAVVLSAIFDSLDGRAARLLKVTSPFGEVLDSLSDFLSFGVAPAILLYEWMFRRNEILGSDVFGLLAVTTFVVCSAMRLARFTAAARPGAPAASAPAEPGEPDPARTALAKARFFTGLATPSAAGAVMVPVMLSYSKLVGPYIRPLYGMKGAGTGDEAAARLDSAVTDPAGWMGVAVLAYTLLIAFWMVSRVPMFSFKKMHISRRAVVPMLVGVGLVVVLAVKDLWLLLPVITLAYLLTAPLSWLSHGRLMRRGA